MLERLAADYFSWRGRIRRRSYWLRSLAAAPVVGAVAGLGALVRPFSPAAAIALAALAICIGGWICATLVVRRFHDHGRHGWIGLAALFAAALIGSAGHWVGAGLPAMTLSSVVGLALSIYVGFVPGMRGPNAYGPDPVAD
ncbi:DUF805 domain-containing protein [Chenggangzhangella methanolivorans]|uniref:DUF805 domain-containing protein n=1 Tax=Chenggangzhangella methanolivorans TaxID=1437009 RepID=A0A9E6RAI6_9HYPH|nr:DUF805 domain-containing protein [Chenggangzhangella methanolivorans]QZO01196.1 DUF805 domain-containing protein [Chenggangzhangella methanolivorans]